VASQGDGVVLTVRHVYGSLHALLHDAVVDELVSANPCMLRRGDLPGKIDKDPLWRSGAIYTRAEVETLISDPRVPEPRRMLYSLLFLGGLRAGDAAALRWRAIDSAVEPLGRLVVAASFNRKKKRETSVKSEQPREVPIHPTLARVLAAWKLGGWAQLMGSQPGPEDLVVPATTGNNLRDPVVHANLQRDLGVLGMRSRRVHDARRTFVSLALADGARKDVLRWMSHGPTGDIVDLYTTLPWAARCEELGRLRRMRVTVRVAVIWWKRKSP
jgi:integrase